MWEFEPRVSIEEIALASKMNSMICPWHEATDILTQGIKFMLVSNNYAFYYHISITGTTAGSEKASMKIRVGEYLTVDHPPLLEG